MMIRDDCRGVTPLVPLAIATRGTHGGTPLQRVVFERFSRARLIVLLLLFASSSQNVAIAYRTLSSFSIGEVHNSQGVTVLELNMPIERELSNDQKDSYQIALGEGQYAGLAVEQRGIDVVARLLDPDGKLIFEFDAESRKQGLERPELVAESAGNYKVEILAKYKLLPGGRYEIRLNEVRPATEKDRSLQRARRLYAEALRLYGAAKFDEAQPLIEQVLEIRTRELGLEHPETATALNQLARIFDNRGNYDKAEQTNQLALRIREKVLEPDHPDIALSLHNLAVTYVSMEEFPKALALHQRALEIRERALGGDHPAIAVSLINMGRVYSDQGDKLRAVELYERALTIQEKVMGSQNLNTVVVLNNLAKVYIDVGDYAKAEPMLRRAIAVLEKLLAPNDPRMADPISNLANLYVYQGDYQKAEPLYLSVLELREKTQGPNHPLTAQAIHNVAELYFSKGDYEKSEPLFRRALELRERLLGPENPAVARTLNGLSRLLALKGDAVQAVNLQQRANAITQRAIELNLSIGSERQRLAYLDVLPEQTNQTISTHVQSAPSLPAAADLAVTTILQRKGRALDAASASLATLRRHFSEVDQALLKQLSDTTAQLARLVLNGPQQGTLVQHQQQIKALEEQREKLESEIGRRSAGFYASSEPAKLASIKAAIPEGAALIEFAVYQPFDPRALRVDKAYGAPHYVAYIIHSKGEVGWRELGEAKAIDEAIDKLRMALRDPKRKDVELLARAVDKRVMQPIRPLLGDAKQLLISPDGALNLVPFEAFVDEHRRYLVQSFSCSYLTTGRDLLRLQVARESKSSAIVLANPLFGEPDLVAETSRSQRAAFGKGRDYPKRQTSTPASHWSEVYFAPLSGTAQEAQAIKSLIANARVLTGAQASESALKQVSAPRIVHIATHGFFLTDTTSSASKGNADGTRAISASVKIQNPLLRSGLALAGANLHKGSDDDGILTALEASGLNLWGTKLVTLSACDTALGEVKNGEGVYSLRRAFVLAGTESLVMSFWPVSDYVTRELMTRYYRGLKHGQGRAEALRNVQLSMLNRKEWRHPFYWAGFIESGEWANLDGKR